MRTAVIHRMVMEKHVCPYGLKARDLLLRKGFAVEDRPLTSSEEVEAFKKEHGVETTPQVWIEGARIGGYDELRAHFDAGATDESRKSYRPVVAIFVMGFLVAAATTVPSLRRLDAIALIERFVAVTMCLLAVPKLQDVESFSLTFLGYDLLAQRWVRYATIYPYAEALAGVLMVGGLAPWLSGPLAASIGAIGGFSVFRAVYVQRRELTCACVGGDSKVPLGAVSLTENLMMLAMGIWTVTKTLV